MNHLKSLALDVDVAKRSYKELTKMLTKFEKTTAKLGEEEAWTQKQKDLKEKSIQVIVRK